MELFNYNGKVFNCFFPFKYLKYKNKLSSKFKIRTADYAHIPESIISSRKTWMLSIWHVVCRGRPLPITLSQTYHWYNYRFKTNKKLHPAKMLSHVIAVVIIYKSIGFIGVKQLLVKFYAEKWTLNKRT